MPLFLTPSPREGGVGLCNGREGFIQAICLSAKPLPLPSQGKEAHIAIAFNLKQR